jgi:hypothetical protein
MGQCQRGIVGLLLVGLCGCSATPPGATPILSLGSPTLLVAARVGATFFAEQGCKKIPAGGKVKASQDISFVQGILDDNPVDAVNMLAGSLGTTDLSAEIFTALHRSINEAQALLAEKVTSGADWMALAGAILQGALDGCSAGISAGG